MSRATLKKRIEKVAATIHTRDNRRSLRDYDLTRLTDAELTALHACFTEAGELIPERLTPALAAAWQRVQR